MSEFIEITGGKKLSGTVTISGAKNAALPMLMAGLMTKEPCYFDNVPNLEDVNLTLKLLEHFGASTSFYDSKVELEVPKLTEIEASYSLVKALRASFWVLGPLLARRGEAKVALPGGDAIGTRPVDIHLSALAKMGADIKLKHGVVSAHAPNGLKPADIDFHFPSVGATHQILMAASLTPGTTTIKGAAREPEVIALADQLIEMGAQIEGAGSDLIVINGRRELGGCNIKLIGDRIEAGTYLIAALASGGKVTVQGIDPSHLGEFLDILQQLGSQVVTTKDSVFVSSPEVINPLSIKTAPFPGFATDLQAPLMPLLCLAAGPSQIEENVFEGRFTHVSELSRMGAKINVHDRIAEISGVEKLSAAPVEGFDIRGAAALIVAALAAHGSTQIYELQHLRRGYESLETKLQALGANVYCRPEELEDCVSIGC